MENRASRTKSRISHRKVIDISDIQKSQTINKSRKINTRKKKNIKPIIIVDYIFMLSLALTIIFGIQTNPVFFTPFVIVLISTIICMGIILINSINSKIKKMINKRKNKIK